jgi:hypothetical protein
LEYLSESWPQVILCSLTWLLSLGFSIFIINPSLSQQLHQYIRIASFFFLSRYVQTLFRPTSDTFNIVLPLHCRSLFFSLKPTITAFITGVSDDMTAIQDLSGNDSSLAVPDPAVVGPSHHNTTDLPSPNENTIALDTSPRISYNPETVTEPTEKIPSVWDSMNRFRLIAVCCASFANGFNDAGAGAVIPYMETYVVSFFHILGYFNI